MNFQHSLKPIGTTARTGEICPESGVWQVVSTPSTTAPIAKGNRMPPYYGTGGYVEADPLRLSSTGSPAFAGEPVASGEISHE